MHARVNLARADPSGGGDLADSFVDAAAIDGATGDRHKERGRAWMLVESVAFVGVSGECFGDAVVEWHEAGAVEFGVSDCDHPAGKIDIVTAQSDGFTDAHSCGREQPE